MQDDGERISTYDMSYACQDLQSVANDESFPLGERDEAAEQLERLGGGTATPTRSTSSARRTVTAGC